MSDRIFVFLVCTFIGVATFAAVGMAALFTISDMQARLTADSHRPQPAVYAQTDAPRPMLR